MVNEPASEHVDKVSRRGVLWLAAAGAAASIGAIGGPASADRGNQAAEGPSATDDHGYDVIIIGAGFAGVTAARELRAKGRRVLLLEARDRIGGRTWTDTFLGQQIERGGAWVDPRQPHVWRELLRYNLPIVADSGVDRVLLPTLNGHQEYDPVEAFELQSKLFTPFFDGAREYFPRPFEPLYRKDLVLPLDGFSMRDRLDQLNYAPEDEIKLTATTSLYGGTSKRGAMTHLAQWWALAGWTFADFHAVNTYRPMHGTVSILNAMLAEASPTIRLNSPVASVTQRGGRVTVTTRSGREYRAPEVIMAVPVNVWKTIQFSPPLPEAHTRASVAGFGVPHEKKLWLNLRNPSDRFFAEGPEGFSICWMGRFNEGQPTVAFSVKEGFDVSNPRQVLAGVREIIPDAELVNYTATDWHTDEFALGVGVFRQPFQLTRLHSKIQRPHGRVKFATGDIADGWSGYIDGAIESGLRVAGSETLAGRQIDGLALAAARGFVVPAVRPGAYR